MQGRFVCISAGVCLGLLSLFAGEHPTTLGGPDLLPGDFIRQSEKIIRPGIGSARVMDEVAAVSPPLVVNIDTAAASPWHAQVKARTTAPVKAGEVLLLTVEICSEQADPATHESAVQVVAQGAAEPFDVEDEAVVLATKQWQKHELPLRIRRDYPAGGMHIALNFAVCRQRVLVRDVGCTSLGPLESTAGLRRPPVSYAGREPDAPWRAAAAERIERIRKSDFTIKVLDSDDRPVADALVLVFLERHDFAFGTAIAASRLMGDGADDRKYRQILRKYFNTVVFESEMKWPAWERQDRAEGPLPGDWQKILNRLRLNKLDLRGHCMVWPQMSRLPPDVRELVRLRQPEALRRRVNAHIARMAESFADQVIEWDVVNEPLSHNALQDVLGGDALAEWFAVARAASPKPRLYLNDFALLSYGALNGGKIDRLYDTLKQLRDAGAPLDALGEQAHFDDILVSPPRMIELLDRFATLDIPIRITEFDVAADDEQLQADYLRDFYTAAFSHPSINGIVMWGFYQKNHWKPQAALWSNDWTIRPHGQAFVDLVRGQWTTRASGFTDENGEFHFRGFKGDYTGAVMFEGKATLFSPAVRREREFVVKLGE